MDMCFCYPCASGLHVRHVLLFPTIMCLCSPCTSILHYLPNLLKFKSIHLVMLTILSLPPPSPLPSIFPSIRVFSNELALHIRWPKCWSFSFSNTLSKEYSGLIFFFFFRIDFFVLLVVQRTLKSLLQHHNLKTSLLQNSAFFMV